MVGRFQRWPLQLRVGVCLLVVLLLLFLLGPLAFSEQADAVELSRRNLAPSWSHLFGTDELGRDLLRRSLLGGRSSLLTAMVAGVAVSVVGGVVGFVGGLSERWDHVIVHLGDVTLGISTFPLLLILAPWFSSFGGGVGLLVAFAAWPIVARVVRAEARSLRSTDVIASAVIAGGTRTSIVWRHLMRGVAGLMVAQVLLVMVSSISVEATMGFFQASSQQSLGLTLFEAKGQIGEQNTRILLPGLTVVVIFFAFYLVSRGVSIMSAGSAPSGSVSKVARFG